MSSCEHAALIITIVINNSPDPDSKQMKMAMAWEAEYIKFMKNFSNPNMNISWNSEVGTRIST